MARNANLPHDRAKGPRVNVQTAAARLGCTVSWVYKLVASGRLVAFRIGSRKGLQVTVRSIEAYLASRRVDLNDKACQN